MSKTQQVLIGNPLELTLKGIVELHKLKHKETYLYKDSIIIPDSLTSPDERLKFFMERETNYVLVEEDEFLLDNEIHKYRIVASSYTDPSKDEFPIDDLLFYGDWKFPFDDKRGDKDLIRLFNNDYNKEYFDYERKPRVFIIPADVEWYIDEDEMCRESIRERGRVWG